MSYSKVNRMHCKVCESAGKSEKEVKSHYPKNRDGFTVCPTLLSQECRHCYKKGHTVKYCNIKKKEEDNTWVLQQERQYALDKQSSFGTTFSKGCNEKANKKAANMLLASFYAFEALYASSDEEEEVKVVVAPKVPRVVVPKVEPKSTKYMDALLQAKPAVEVKPRVIKPAPVKINWATAESDSEGDDSESD